MPTPIKTNGVRIGAIHIIESLRAGEPATGEALRDYLGSLVTLSGVPIEISFSREPTKACLFQRLDGIAQAVRDTGRSPVIHLEMHGDENGLQLTSDEIVRWSEFKDAFTKVNVTSRLNLLVLVQACYGNWVLEVVQPTDRAPLWGLIGPNRKIWPDEIERGNKAFYSALFATRDGGAAWQEMNAAIPAGDSPFTCLLAEEMFSTVVSSYFQDHCSEAQMKERVASLVARAKMEHLPVPGDVFERYVDGHDSFLEALRVHFFLVDLCPDHAQRFRAVLSEQLRVQ